MPLVTNADKMASVYMTSFQRNLPVSKFFTQFTKKGFFCYCWLSFFCSITINRLILHVCILNTCISRNFSERVNPRFLLEKMSLWKTVETIFQRFQKLYSKTHQNLSVKESKVRTICLKNSLISYWNQSYLRSECIKTPISILITFQRKWCLLITTDDSRWKMI